MFSRANRRSGFTLPEVLVTVAIVAVLAAMVVPAVTQQISKGDDAELQSSVANLRTSITAFVSDTRKFPARISDLFNEIADTDLDLFGVAYGTAVEARWRGPYMSGSLAAASDLTLSHTDIADALVDSTFGTATAVLVIATLPDITTQAQAILIDGLIDDGNGNAAGILRWNDVADPIAVGGGQVKLMLMGAR